MTDTKNIRELALDILMEILEKGSYSHVVLGQALGKYQYLTKQDRGFITRITEGVLEYLIQIDWMLNRYSSTKVEKMKPVIRTILRMSVYQIVYLDRIPDAAACNEGVKLAIKRKFTGLKGFVNGILRRISREKESMLKELAEPAFPWPFIRYSIPEWLYEMWKKELGQEQTDGILSAFLQQAPTTVRCNLSLASKNEILDSLSAQAAEVTESPYSDKVLLLSGYDYLEGLEAFLKGWIQVQDLSSVFAGEAVCPEKGSYVLDVCAAPGGKSLHMADMLAGTGMVEARDISQAKAELIKENISRSGFSNICVTVQDALEFVPESAGKADILLADLPCSGLGIIGKKPDIKLHMTPDKLEALKKLQREILAVVWQYVKPGGILVYSTCTIHKGENQETAEWFLNHYPFKPVDLTGQFGDQIQETSLKEGQMQFLPGKYPCDGFFIAVFRRDLP
ncbi:MAG: 16S rRNA (cytosine(967)-C(5))-methyltransferase RsmB [Lachnospiraceae bacterium]|jgi:16S rRNA (cytosine967-C5)-methyltransferase|nr:16S rRNA (cytosine(967)-C(5))-methyltransferase RsmB [Lachnospiraceae bacterium]